MTEIPSGQTGRPARFKSIPKSKVTEWSGLDRIEAVVHGMTSIWREQEKDDIGIDGEIELCVARSDGEGLVGTGKIVKVQSKAGSSYVVRDNDGPLVLGRHERACRLHRLPSRRRRLYWKDVKAYLAERPDTLTPPHRIEFDKGVDRFDENARPALHEICRTAPERISTEVGETLYTNLLEIERMPERVWLAPVQPQKQPHFHDRLTGDIPPYVFRDGVVATLSDPRDPGGALAHVVDESAADDLALADWLAQDPDADNDLRRLMNSLVHRHLRSVGLSYQKHPRRYFFNRHLAQDSPLRRSWTSSRTGRKNSRFVAKQYE